MEQSDYLIIGGGIIGLATAWQLSRRHPQATIVVLEKEPRLAEHQTGRNSGVLHSGIYYKPGSLRAINCRAGKAAMEAFCSEHNLPYEICGKVIVAVSEAELPALNRIYERGQANGVNCQLIGPERLHELEPHAAGVQAIHVPEAGIVNYRRVTEKLAELVSASPGRVVTNARVTAIRREGPNVIVHSTSGEFAAPVLVNCTGLHSDRIAALAGARPEAKIVPFRGEYYELRPESRHLCRNLIYPVPDPKFPFLGVHFTRMIEGGVECGPNAVLAFAREGYRKTNVNLRDLVESLTYGGFLRMAWKHWPTGLGEMWRSVSKRAFLRALQRLVPEVRSEDLLPGRAGVRAQALGRDGVLVDDFVIQVEGNIVNVLNAPSPAATSSLNIGKLIVEKLEQVADA
jgi:(S)-2-hydroxyglutarate dehydrogenase